MLAASALLVTGPLGAGAARADDGDGRLVTSAEILVTTDAARVFDDAFGVAEFEDEWSTPATTHSPTPRGANAARPSHLSYPDRARPAAAGGGHAGEPGRLPQRGVRFLRRGSGAYQSVVSGEPVRLTRSVDGYDDRRGRVEERCIKDKGNDDRSEERYSYEIDD